MVTVSGLLLLLSVFFPPVYSRFTTPHFIPGKLNYTEAVKVCRENYTDIITVYSDEENTELKNMLQKSGYQWSWIGLSRGQFSEKWSNGDPVTFRNLAVDCGTGISCAVMKGDGLWESIQCNGTRPFMCYEQDASSGTPKYHLIVENKTWYEAQHYCRENYTDLVSIRDQQQNTEVNSKAKNSTDFWIGLLCDDWQWTDGGNSTYRNWWSNKPQLTSDCVALIGQRWYMRHCNFSGHVLCYSNSLHVSEEALSWQKALHYCHEENRAGMLTIDSQAEQEELEFELRKRGVPPGSLWVGLGPNRLSELKVSSRPLTCEDVVRQTEARESHCAADTCTAKAAPDYVTDSTKLRVVCKLQQVP